MSKGEETRRFILEMGLELATQLGLESISIGLLAKAAGMSKSGLFAHFNSKENLQIAILEFAAENFSQSVVVPALKEPAGIQRITAMIRNWISFSSKLSGGCIFTSTAVEFSDRPGKVRDLLLSQQNSWVSTLRRIGKTAVKTGDFRKNADLDQFAFDVYSMLMGVHYYGTLLNDSMTNQYMQNSFRQLLEFYGSADLVLTEI